LARVVQVAAAGLAHMALKTPVMQDLQTQAAVAAELQQIALEIHPLLVELADLESSLLDTHFN